MEPTKNIINYIRYDIDMTRAAAIAMRLNEIERSQKIMRRNLLTIALFAVVNIAALRAANQAHVEKIKKLREEIRELKGE